MKYTKEYKLFDAKVSDALACVKDLQPFLNYYVWRSAEFKNLFSQVGKDFWGDVLEVGCGNGFNASLIASFANRVIATDLESANTATESPGIDSAHKLIRALKVDNCSVVPARAEKLSFKDNTFDVVYSNYTLEHIKNREAAISEMARVVKKSGILVIIVPNFMERLTYIPFYYAYLVKRALFHGANIIKSNILRKNNSKAKFSQSKQFLCNPNMFYQRHSNFPFPDIHGWYSTFSKELVSSFYFKWHALFNKSGLKQVKSFSSIIIPWHILSIFNARFPLWAYKRSLSLQAKIGSLFPLKYFGHNLCLIYKKQ